MPSPSAAAERSRDGRTRVRATARRIARCLVVVACLGGCATKAPLLPKTAEMSEGIPADAHMKVLTKRRLPTAPKARPKAPPLPTIPGRRIALVIGNGAYERRPLGNSVRDAKRLAQALRAPSLGFAVIERKNLDHEGMRDALREFRRQLAGAQVALFYYAGHGVQAAGRNYMLPIGSLDEMATQEDYSIHGVDVDEVQQLLARSQTAARLTILDARAATTHFPRGRAPDQRGGPTSPQARHRSSPTPPPRARSRRTVQPVETDRTSSTCCDTSPTPRSR